MRKTDQINNFKENFLRIINKFKDLEKIPLDHGTGHLLYAAEINTLELIGKFPGINLTQLAQKKGVTKGAVSQIVSKLVDKQLVAKEQATGNEKAVSLALTSLGRVAFANHEKFHEKYDTAMVEKLKGMSEEQLKLIGEVFGMLEGTIDNYLKELR